MILLAAILAAHAGLVESSTGSCVEDAHAAAGLPAETPVVSPWPEAARLPKVAVVVGVACQDTAFGAELPWATRDAVAVERWLATSGFVVIRLASHVKRADFLSTLREATRRVEDGGDLIVYFSGHGWLDASAGGVERRLVMSDSTPQDSESTVRALDVEAIVGGAPAGHRILILDSCFAAAPPRDPLATAVETAKEIPVHTAALLPGDYRLYATVTPTSAYMNQEHQMSWYTWHLMQALGAGDDIDGDGCSGLLEAHLDATRETLISSEGRQQPIERHLPRRGEPDDLVFGACQPIRSRKVVVLPGPPGTTVTLRSAEAEWTITEAKALDPARWSVEIRDASDASHSGRLLRRAIPLRSGVWLDPGREMEHPDVLRERVAGILAAGISARAGSPPFLPGWSALLDGWLEYQRQPRWGFLAGVSLSYSPLQNRGTLEPQNPAAAGLVGPDGLPRFASLAITARLGGARRFLLLHTHEHSLGLGAWLGAGPAWHFTPWAADLGVRGELAIRGDVSMGLLVFALDLGLSLEPVIAQERPTLQAGPTFRLTLGVRP